VVLLQTIQMHREEQIGRGFEQIELLLEQQRVVHNETNFLRATRPRTISPISL